MTGREAAGNVQVHGLARTFGRRPVLRDATFTLPRGAVTAIIGQNGAGKSTTFNVLSGRIPPTAGRVHYAGTETTERDRGRSFGYVAHASFLYGALTARENLTLVAALHGRPTDGLPEILERIGLTRAADRAVRTYSRGMTQRLAIGRLLVFDPPVWLLDEPASGLDAKGRTWLEAEIRGLVSAGKVVALSSHSRDLVAELARHVVVLAGGRIAHTGPLPEDRAAAAAEVERLFSEHIG